MRLYEFANAQEQLALWKLISDSVWDSISVQAQAQEQKRAKDAKTAKKTPKSSPSKLSAKRAPQKWLGLFEQLSPNDKWGTGGS